MICSACGTEKEQSEFYFRSDSGKYRTDCKDCCKKRGKAHYDKDPEKHKAQSKAWARENREQKNANYRKWCEKNPEKRKEIVHKHYLNHKDKKNADSVRWQKENPERMKEIRTKEHKKNNDKYREYAREYCSERYRSDPAYRVKMNMSSAVNACLRSGKNRKTWVSLLGYGVPELRKHLERQFKPGMTWENYGPVWHIDHKIPISAFNITSYGDYDFKRCWSLKNLQPLFSEENLKKHNSLERPFQPSLL